MKISKIIFVFLLTILSLNIFASNLNKSDTKNFKFEIEKSELNHNEVECTSQQLSIITRSLETLIIENHYPVSSFAHIQFIISFKESLLFNKSAMVSSANSNFSLINIVISEEDNGGCNLVSSDIIQRKLLQQARENKSSEGANILDQALSIRLY